MMMMRRGAVRELRGAAHARKHQQRGREGQREQKKKEEEQGKKRAESDEKERELLFFRIFLARPSFGSLKRKKEKTVLFSDASL